MCNKLDPLEPDPIASVYEILFPKVDRLLKYNVKMTGRKF